MPNENYDIFLSTYGQRNNIVCPSRPQVKAWMDRRVVVSAGDLPDMLANYSGSCGSCGGSSCSGSDDFDWKDMALIQMLPGLAQVAIAGIAKLFGIDMGGSAQATQAGGAQQGSGIFPTNAQNGVAQQGSGVNVGGYNGGYNVGGAPAPSNTTTSSPTTTTTSSPTTTTTPSPITPDTGDKGKAPKTTDDKGTAGTTPATTTITSPVLSGADSAMEKCNKAKTKGEKSTALEKVKEYGRNFDALISAKDAEIAVYDETISEQDGILEKKRNEKAGALSAYNKAKGAYNAQNGKTNDAKGAVDTQESNLAKANGELKSLTNAWNEAKGNTASAQEDYNNAEAAYNNAVAQNAQPKDLEKLERAKTEAKGKLEAAKGKEKAALKAKETKEEQIGALEAELERLKEDYNKQKTELDKCEKAMKNAEKTIEGLENDTEYQAAIVARDKAMQGKAAVEAQKREFELKKTEVDAYIAKEGDRIAALPEDNKPTE